MHIACEGLLQTLLTVEAMHGKHSADSAVEALWTRLITVDTRLRHDPGLECLRAEVSKGGMATGSVILDFDGLEKGLAEAVGVHQRHTMDALNLQAMEKALHHRIVIAAATAARAGDKPVATDQIAMVPATVNAAAVRMHDHASRLATPGKRRFQRRTGEPSVNARACCPSDDLAGAQIENHRQVEPALCCAQVGDVTSPLLIRSLGAEVLGKQVGATPRGWPESVVC